MRERALGIGGSRGYVCGLAALAIAALVAPSPVAGQAAPDTADGIRLLYGPTVARPFLDDSAEEVFAGLGEDFRTALGIRLGVGYRAYGVEVAATAEYAGMDVGDPFERDGIGMGRRSSILRGYTATVWWVPASLEAGGWRPLVGGGYVAGGIDNVSMEPGQLSGEPADLARGVEPGSEAHPTGLSGSGFRIGAGAERDLSAALAIQLHLEADRMHYDEFIYGSDRFDVDLGSGWVGRVVAELKWGI